MAKGKYVRSIPNPKKTKRTKKSPFIIHVLLSFITIFILAATVYKIIEFVTSQNSTNNFPKLEISLAEVPIEQINIDSKDVEHPEKSAIKYPNNTITFTINNETTVYNDVEIKGHGNSTWAQAKKPYQLKLPEKTSLFGYGASKKWILLADYQDETHLRNDTAFFLEHLLKPENNINGHHLELYIDNIYYGLYYLAEKVEIGKNRLDLKDPSGIITEIDNLHNTDEICPIHAKNGDCIIIHDVVNQDLSDQSMEIFIKKFNDLVTATSKKDYTTISKIIDVDSFARYFLIKEFTNDQDAYGSSFFLYTDGEQDKIHVGPAWDFDAAFGNKHLGEYSEAISPSSDTIFKNISTSSNTSKTAAEEHALHISNVVYSLLDIPEFKARVKEIYQSTLSGHSEEILDHIKNQAIYIRDAALRDQERWKLKTNFDEEVDYLIDWVAKRYNHFEQTYGKDAKEPEENKNEEDIESSPKEIPAEPITLEES
ncbi:CotH kinase family protein [Candidatus Saccharibacteria bacterium]|nr:CotH kinase family protein [Candidatus Saccharibacteria bacterium]